MMVGRLLSYWEVNFSGAMLNFGRVTSSRWWGCICQDSGGSKRSHWSHWRLWFCQGSSGVVNPEVTEIYNYPTPGCQICGKIKVLVWGSSQPTYPPPTYHDHFKKNTTTSSKHLLAKTLPDVFLKEAWNLSNASTTAIFIPQNYPISFASSSTASSNAPK